MPHSVVWLQNLSKLWSDNCILQEPNCVTKDTEAPWVPYGISQPKPSLVLSRFGSRTDAHDGGERRTRWPLREDAVSHSSKNLQNLNQHETTKMTRTLHVRTLNIAWQASLPNRPKLFKFHGRFRNEAKNNGMIRQRKPSSHRKRCGLNVIYAKQAKMRQKFPRNSALFGVKVKLTHFLCMVIGFQKLLRWKFYWILYQRLRVLLSASLRHYRDIYSLVFYNMLPWFVSELPEKY